MEKQLIFEWKSAQPQREVIGKAWKWLVSMCLLEPNQCYKVYKISNEKLLKSCIWTTNQPVIVQYNIQWIEEVE